MFSIKYLIQEVAGTVDSFATFLSRFHFVAVFVCKNSIHFMSFLPVGTMYVLILMAQELFLALIMVIARHISVGRECGN